MCVEVTTIGICGIVPGLSHWFAGDEIYQSKNIMRMCIGNTNGSYKEDAQEYSKTASLRKAAVGVSLARDILALVAIVTLAVLSLLTPLVAIPIGAALVLSIALSSTALGYLAQGEKAAKSYLDSLQ